ncbi:MAG TPA: hypothetical protein VE593_12590 [Nitrososphaeraceae archaeon]|nr:hypothetical protein [Nitrososphaeraceae archaeon]
MNRDKSRIIKGFVLLSRVDVNDDCVQRISQLLNKMTRLEGEIAEEFEILKEKYLKASSSMPDAQTYLLAGIQANPTSKSYLLTNKGIEVLGEEPTPLTVFLDNVIRYANWPKRKIEVLMELANHLQKIIQMINESPRSA